MRKAIKNILVLFLFIFTLTACTSNEKYIGVKGIVTDKEFEKAHTYTIWIYVGKVMVPQQRYAPDRWYLTVEYNINGETEDTRYEVTEELYDTYEIGDIYIYNGEVDE